MLKPKDFSRILSPRRCVVIIYVENQAYVASCLCMFLSIFRILFSFFNFPELMQFIVIITVIITVIIIFDLESF